ncbi:MAG: polyphosphate kinase 2, partial [Anaerolineales bacterium]|nr:polyphosphate kinase 2 [Anaerolineales bacterium]
MMSKNDKKHKKSQAETVADANGGTAPRVATVVDTKMGRKDFEKELEKLQVELVKLQEWVKFSGARSLYCSRAAMRSARDGIIKRLTERTSPRVFRVVALSSPTEREKSQMYMQRYVPYLPAAGEVVLFDRSWYNRAGVERVMGFATEEQVATF